MSQHQPATRTQPSRAARLKALAARPALIALMAAGLIAGSAGIAAAGTVTCPPCIHNCKCA